MVAPVPGTPNPVVTGIGTSIVRTVVPLVMAPLLTWAAKAGLNIDSVGIASTVGTIVTVLYYAVVRILETRIAPAWGYLLGVAKVPAYPTIPGTSTQEAASDSVNVEIPMPDQPVGDNLPPTS